MAPTNNKKVDEEPKRERKISNSLLHSPLTSHQLGHDGICQDPRLLNLEKQLNIELKVKQGAENIMQTINGKSHRDKKLMAEAQQMFLDAKAKIEFLKMRILKVKNEINNKHHGSMHDLANGDVSTCELETPLEDRIEDIRHRLKIELAVVDGAKNVISVAYLEDVNKMYGGRPDQQQQWTVHAEFTIKHDGMEDPSTLPKTHTERDENGVRMVYSWTSQPPATSTTNTNDSHSFRTDRSTTSSGSDVKDPQLPYGFQRGNLVFTSTPPKRHPFPNTDPPSKGLDSSGYGSELLSPNSGGLPYRPIQPYNRRCRSTCSIVLSADFDQKAEDNPDNPQCGRTHSLRCQTPTAKSDKKDYYGCGDPWCYHACGEDYCRFPPLQEMDEYDSTSSKRPSRASTFTVRQSDRSKSSPSKVSVKRTVKGPAKLGKLHDTKSSSPDSKASDKKPRTVHIDVYCTGTELESSSSSCSDSENKTTSSPQTVFESEKFRLTHKRAFDKDVPYHIRKSQSNDSTSNVHNLRKKFEKDESDDDEESTPYPSQMSSFSAIKDTGSSFSTNVPPSWSTMSMTSYALPDDDSVANTSWKDTYSDLGSLLESRSSIAQTDSLDFVPRKLWQRTSIEESPENGSLAETPSKASLQPSDSFEYANSEDRLRIMKMERMWGQDKPMRAPLPQKKYLVQQKKLKEYLDKRMSDKSLPKWESKDTDSEGTDSEEKGWTILKEQDKDNPKAIAEIVKKCAERKSIENPVVIRAKLPDRHINASDSHLASKSPSILAIRQRLTANPTLGSPFTIFPGIFTEQRAVAKRFGNIVNVFKKPGHHIGPAKNPDCTCDHCRRYFEVYGMRLRARSLGGDSSGVIDWKEVNRSSVPPDVMSPVQNDPVDDKMDLGYTDF
ncbi:hypothetical protein MML48_1g10246 [Holotrichia oblita]|uniref:Uncharacterized protein n=1 Tax=Holotrichia oblita TaxID=644536 RepID=A0ACB9TWJ3_HOLOL|nr:hypothetical protein MML48_1g10246 [Holotrichia oblita]